MKITLVAYGIARDILQSKKIVLDVDDATSVELLRQRILKTYPDFLKLKSLLFAVGETYREDSFILHENDEVVVIPPVSGG